LKPIYRNFLVEDLVKTVAEYKITGTVVVQAHQSVEETRWLLELAEQSNLILGVVGWVDLKDPELRKTLADLKKHTKFRGVRHIIQDEPDASWMLQTEVMRGLRILHEEGLTYDLLIKPHQLDTALRLIDHLPAMPIILDHIAKPYIKEGKREPGQHKCGNGEVPHLYCKISGLITEADHAKWKTEDFTFYQSCGRGVRLGSSLLGRDWPVCLLAGDYGQVLQLSERY
jgi:L-fuconolactonase